jgi:hypothetical protein
MKILHQLRTLHSRTLDTGSGIHEDGRSAMCLPIRWAFRRLCVDSAKFQETCEKSSVRADEDLKERAADITRRALRLSSQEA